MTWLYVVFPSTAISFDYCRLLNYSGVILSHKVNEMVRTYEPSNDWDRPDVCGTCGGTLHSGALFVCSGCGTAERHTHCILPYPYMSGTKPPVPLSLPKTVGWLCDDCCHVSKDTSSCTSKTHFYFQMTRLYTRYAGRARVSRFV
jgi:hypothetical protein